MRLWLFLLAILSAPAFAADPPAVAIDPGKIGATQVVGLFLKACVNFSGDKAGLREWAARSGLVQLPASASDAFLYGLPGIVFDATAQRAKLVLISEDGGSCSAVAEIADGAAVIDELERALKASQIALNMTRDAGDAKEAALRHREYTASAGKRQWQMLVSTVQAPGGGSAMLTVNPG